MYQIQIDGNVVFDPRSSLQKAINPKISYELNKSGTLTFTIPYGNNVIINELKSNVKVFKNGSIIFEGRAFKEDKDFYSNRKVTVYGVLDFLNDSIIEPFDHQFNSAKEFLQYLLNNHNSQVESYKSFFVGNVDVPLNGNIIQSKHEDYLTTWELIQKNLLDVLDGYITVRYKNDKKYIDYTVASGVESSQEIRFGKNLLDLTQYTKAEDIKTVLIPLGKKLDDGTYVTIKSVNNGVNYISNHDSINIYGLIKGVHYWENVTEPINLLNKAKEYIKNCANLALTLELTALDLSLIDSSVEEFKLGNYPLIISPPHNLACRMQISKKVLDLERPDNDSITLGYIRDGIINSRYNNTSKLEKDIKAANAKVSNLSGEIDKIEQDNQHSTEELNKQKQYIMLGV